MRPERTTRFPAASWLALLAAGVSLALIALTSSGDDPGSTAGAVLAFAVPYVAIALLLRGSAVWERAGGVALAALMTWLPSSGLREFVGSLQQGSMPRPLAVSFVGLTAIGLAVLALGAGELVAAARAARYWSLTPWAARLAFLAVAYLALVFVADTYLTSSPSLPRMLMVPLLMVANLGSALTLRAANRTAQATGVLVAAGSALATVAYWAARPVYFAITSPPASLGDFGYSTLLPWPVLLPLLLVLETAVVVTGIRRLVREAGRQAPTVRD